MTVCKTWSGDVIGTAMKANEDYRRPYGSPTLLLMGSEGAGLSEELSEACNIVARIPMAGDAESLNVATAAALMLYEINRAELK